MTATTARSPAAGSSMSTGQPLTGPAAATAIDAACRALRLPTIRARVDEHVTAAEREQQTYHGFLAELLLAECDDRDERRRARRVHDAAFPRPKRLEDFDFAANPGINPATVNALATGNWVAAGQPLCLIGDSGTGKSHLLIGLGTAAAEAGHRVRYVLASRLVNELAEADNDRQLTKVIGRYGRVDLLCLDELGYLHLDRRGAELLFQVLTEREERNSVAIATNEPFSGWTKTFTDPRLCAAIVDRLTFGGHILETGTTSYRLAHPAPNEPRHDHPRHQQVGPLQAVTPGPTRVDTATASPGVPVIGARDPTCNCPRDMPSSTARQRAASSAARRRVTSSAAIADVFSARHSWPEAYPLRPFWDEAFTRGSCDIRILLLAAGVRWTRRRGSNSHPPG